MKDIVIRGSGGLAREVALLIERINQVSPTWNLLGYIDVRDIGETKYGYRVLGKDSYLKKFDSIDCVIAIAEPEDRLRVKVELEKYNLNFPTLIDPSVIMGKDINCGKGSILTASSILTTGISVGEFCVLNTDIIIGHDVNIGDFCTINPSCNISGFVKIGSGSLIGVGATIIQNVSIGSSAVVGAGSVVIRKVGDRTTVFGSPAVKLS